MTLACLAPAKVNLFLHVVGRRADGYHELQTVFQFLDHCDRLEFDVREDGAVRRANAVDGVPEDQDLVVRAARTLQAATGTTQGCDIRITKNIPLGAGLGGGSSDAASTLLALNRLWQVGLSTQRLAELGLQLGADVPVFVHGRAAWAEGVGEILTPLDLPEPWYLVITPACQASTRELFADPDLRRDTPRMDMADFHAGRGGNDFEPLARRRHPEVAAALDWLGRHAPSRLSGSGSSVFASFEAESRARHIAGQLPDGWHAFVARGLNRSPARVG